MTSALFVALALAMQARPHVDAWQDDRSCATNALTWALYILGIPTDRESVARHFGPVTESGHSLLQIRTAARWYWVFPAVHQLPTDEILNLRPPFILHTSTGRLHTEHFSVVYRVAHAGPEPVLRMFDGTTGTDTKLTRNGLARNSAGYVVTFNMLPLQLLVGAIVVLNSVGAALWIRCRYRAGSTTKAPPSGAGVTPWVIGAFSRVSTLVCTSGVVLCLQSPTAAEDVTIAAVVAEINAAKERLLHYPGGCEAQCRHYATEDPTKDFSFDALALRIAWKWPMLFVSASGTSKSDQSLMQRVSVYNFEAHTSIALDQSTGDVQVVPERHMFSSGYAKLFQAMYWAEASQSYRYGGDHASMDAIPECLARDFVLVGIEDVDGEECVHLQNPDIDDIWLARHRNLLAHRRETRHFKHGPLRRVTRVLSYTSPAKGIWLPEKTELKHYFGADLDPKMHNQVKVVLRIDVENIRLGGVSDSLFSIQFPDGARVTDLVNNRNYYNNRPFDSVVARPAAWKVVLVAANVAVAIGVALWLITRRRRRDLR